MELDLIEQCREFICELRDEWYWKRGTTPQNNRLMVDIDGVIARLEDAIRKTKEAKP